MSVESVLLDEMERLDNEEYLRLASETRCHKCGHPVIEHYWLFFGLIEKCRGCGGRCRWR